MSESMDLAVIGSGISGLSAAWLLSRGHRVTVFETERRAGGHSHTRIVAGPTPQPVDTGFIVYNEAAYPNLSALFAHLEVPTKASDMTFAVSLEDGRLEYSGTDLNGLFAQRGNVLSLRFWSMLRDLLRFYRSAPLDSAALGLMSLDEYLTARGYGEAFRHDHLYPMASAIWSTPADRIGGYPIASFVRFCENHSLLKLANRPAWRTVDGGSREYVQRLLADFDGTLRLDAGVVGVDRFEDHVELRLRDGSRERFDRVVFATHADQALRLLDAPSDAEAALLGAIRYTRNRAVLHSDISLMPRSRRVWSSWNYASKGRGADAALCVTYWMNRLQGIDDSTPLFVTLNPVREPDPALVHSVDDYEHPVFDAAAVDAQQSLWQLQGRQRTWFCGAWFGAGFHEDGLQSGLAVAEQLGGLRRPWRVAGESNRIVLGPMPALAA